MTDKLQEYDTVKLIKDVEDVPKDSVGVVLIIYGDQAEVEFVIETSKISYTVDLSSIKRIS